MFKKGWTWHLTLWFSGQGLGLEDLGSPVVLCSWGRSCPRAGGTCRALVPVPAPAPVGAAVPSGVSRPWGAAGLSLRIKNKQSSALSPCLAQLGGKGSCWGQCPAGTGGCAGWSSQGPPRAPTEPQPRPHSPLSTPSTLWAPRPLWVQPPFKGIFLLVQWH